MEHDRRMSIDVTKSEVGEFKLGDKVTATVTGEVYELQAENPYGPPVKMEGEGKMDDIPPSIGIKIKGKVKLSPAKSNNAFTKMANEENEDD